ncbi:hypothetical protein [Indiicoccus explosivorum]|uniref:hypothetical protein n=1 Tax=Indiicoccus explosivorum TaxID=1917864 RepID=UPI0015880B5E|nr:hypothetical protein [Indiicoccus explosivorum]
MAGYIFNLNSRDSLIDCIENGVYSTIINVPENGRWNRQIEGTFADFLSMKAGDNVYFFHERKIYGLGVLKKVGEDCKYLNFPESDLPVNPEYDEVRSNMLINEGLINIKNRCVCLFESSPEFFVRGVDMDDVLASNPQSFRMLRAFWKLSFVKVGDEENKALKDIILKSNEENLRSGRGRFAHHANLHPHVMNTVNGDYYLTSKNLLKNCSSDDLIGHEMAIEAALIDVLSAEDDTVFGKWDYISHQVIASPFKPIDYMDKMDIFGYRFIPSFDTISRYLLIEIKKDSATLDAIEQLMKYVDWINQEYSHGDYSMICAFLVAYDFPEEVISYRRGFCERNYIKGRRPAITAKWRNVRLIKYSFNRTTEKLEFTEVDPL